jgi:hypothetical protein
MDDRLVLILNKARLHLIKQPCYHLIGMENKEKEP